MKHLQETLDADGAVTERRYYVDGEEVDQATFDAADDRPLQEQIDELRERVDRAAAAAVTGDAAKVRDALKATP